MIPSGYLFLTSIGPSAFSDKDDCRLLDMLCQLTDEINFLGQNLLKEVHLLFFSSRNKSKLIFLLFMGFFPEKTAINYKKILGRAMEK